MELPLGRPYFFVVIILIALWLGMIGWILNATGFTFLVHAPPKKSELFFPEQPAFSSATGVHFFTYHVVSGDNFLNLAKKFEISEGALRSLNGADSPTDPEPETSLLIPSKEGIFHLVLSGQSLSDIAKAYDVPLKEVLENNHKIGNADLHAGEILYLPGAHYLSHHDINWISLEALHSKNGFQKPTTGRFADGFGERIHPLTGKKEFHLGLDLAPGWRARVVASQVGKVVFANIRAGYGKLIILDHGGGLTSWYAHLDEILVELHQTVEKGELIGKVGRSGHVTGPHLHFEIRLNNNPQNPLLYLVQ